MTNDLVVLDCACTLCLMNLILYILKLVQCAMFLKIIIVNVHVIIYNIDLFETNAKVMAVIEAESIGY